MGNIQDTFLGALKVTVSVILGDPPCKSDNAHFTWVPFKPLSVC